MSDDLKTRHCVPCEGGTDPLSPKKIDAGMKQIDARWQHDSSSNSIQARFEFRNYYETTSFVNAVVWIAHQEDHHPDISFGYRACTVTYTTHAVKGLSDNDFICAARVDALLE